MNPQNENINLVVEEKEEEVHSTPISTIKQNPPATLLPITCAVVSHPFIKENMFNNYMVYKVTFKFNDSDQEVNRRYSDFDSLRKAIKMYRPFNFVYPVHRKQFIVSLSGDCQARFREGPN